MFAIVICLVLLKLDGILNIAFVCFIGCICGLFVLKISIVIFFSLMGYFLLKEDVKSTNLSSRLQSC